MYNLQKCVWKLSYRRILKMHCEFEWISLLFNRFILKTLKVSAWIIVVIFRNGSLRNRMQLAKLHFRACSFDGLASWHWLALKLDQIQRELATNRREMSVPPCPITLQPAYTGKAEQIIRALQCLSWKWIFIRALNVRHVPTTSTILE